MQAETKELVQVRKCYGAAGRRFRRSHATGRHPVRGHRLSGRQYHLHVARLSLGNPPPAGTLAGVSGYQLNFGDQEITTPGDSPFVLVAMNPAALKVNLCELQPGGIIVVNEDEFTPAGLKKAEYQSNPLEDGSLQGYRVIPVAITRLNEEAVRPTGLPRQHWDRCRTSSLWACSCGCTTGRCSRSWNG